MGRSYEKLNVWAKQGAELCYLSSNRDPDDVQKDLCVLEKYDFPRGQLFYRKYDQNYIDIVEKIVPDILIEDDCESIGGELEMIYPNMSSLSQQLVKSIVVKEFEGIDHLPDNVEELKMGK